ncbi:phytanoyl-CoA dioxygenase [bacterium]|nr:MAG: phytanoyl-CoA dioxygenase [bacterium]
MALTEIMSRNSVEIDGFAVVDSVISSTEIEVWRELVAGIEGRGVSKRESIFAIRNLLDVPEIRDMARSLAVRNLIEPTLGPNCFAVRGIFFDKTPDANWKVPYHQDLSIAVREKIETPGFGPWSEKAGAVHVQPPTAVLEKMLTIRIHLDDTDEANGALRVIPGSQRLGKIESGHVAREAEQGEVAVPVVEGGAMLMRPLLLHASSPARNARHRRVIHLEFAGTELSGELEWLNRV